MREYYGKNISINAETEEIINNFISRDPDIESFSPRLAEMVKDLAAELGRAKSEVADMFTDSELNYIRDSINGAIITEKQHPVRYLVMSIRDSDEYDNLGAKWEVDAAALAEKIAALPSFHGYALLKSCQEWWAKQ